MKQVPGGGVTEMVYDTKDRLVMSRDARLKELGYWTVNKYDSLNRLIKNGLIVNSSSRTAHQSQSDLTLDYPFLAEGGVLQENYYDNYLWNTGQFARTASTAYNNSAYFITSYNTAPYYARDIACDTLNVKGKVTGSKKRMLGTGTWLASIIYYDFDGRVLQTKESNVSGGPDQFFYQYDFSGNVLRTLHTNEKWGINPKFTLELTKFEYDHANRLRSVTKKIGYSGMDKLILTNTYNELGKLKSTVYGDNTETQDQEYNIRGWGLGVNRQWIKNGGNRFFGYELGYDNKQCVIPGTTYGSPDYRGNIGGLLWKTAGDNASRRYDFLYDASTRLINADFNQFTGGSFNKQAGIDYSAKSIAYDDGGNILKMSQWGYKEGSSTKVDSLSYTYRTRSNKLASVADQIVDTASKLGDFKDGTNAGDDYSYDSNGNLMSDQNKGITSISYNHLNLPSDITVSGKGRIKYFYDNSGTKLLKTTKDFVTGDTTTWMYLTNYVYKNDTLQYFTHEAGRARPEPAQAGTELKVFNYDYFLKDHLGNVRMVLTEEKDTALYPTLTYEDVNVANQNAIWEKKDGTSIGVGSVRQLRPGAFGDGTATGNGTWVGLATKAGGIPAAKLLKVMALDTIETRLEYYYNKLDANNTGASNFTALIANIAAAIGNSGNVSSHLRDAAAALTTNMSNPSIGLQNFLNKPNTTNGGNNAPKAYLTILFFDDQFKPDTSGSIVVPIGYLAPGGSGVKGIIDRFSTNASVAKKNGYAYIFFSNESQELVYFDNFMLRTKSGPIREETHYYPFGLTMAAISSKAMGKIENKLKFASQLLDDDFGVSYYQFRYRTMDPQIGRFLQIDPLSERYVYNSTYAYAENDVTNSIDLEGLERGPIRYLSPSTNFIQNKRMYREVNSFVPQATRYRNSGTFIPNQASGSAATPANIYEPLTAGKGDQWTGPFITRGNTLGRVAAALTDGIEAYKDHINSVRVSTDKIGIGFSSSTIGTNVSITWNDKAAEKSFNQAQAKYDSDVQSIQDNNKLPAAPGAGASQEEWNQWLSESKKIMASTETQMSLLGPSPTQQVLYSTEKSQEFKRVSSETSTLPSISQGRK